MKTVKHPLASSRLDAPVKSYPDFVGDRDAMHELVSVPIVGSFALGMVCDQQELKSRAGFRSSRSWKCSGGCYLRVRGRSGWLVWQDVGRSYRPCYGRGSKSFADIRKHVQVARR